MLSCQSSVSFILSGREGPRRTAFVVTEDRLSPQTLQCSTQLNHATQSTRCAADLPQHACALDAVKPPLPMSTSGAPAKHRLPGDLCCQQLNKDSAECVEGWCSPSAVA